MLIVEDHFLARIALRGVLGAQPVLAEGLSVYMDAPVVDSTGVQGRYDVALETAQGGPGDSEISLSPA